MAEIWRAVFAAEYVRLRDGSPRSMGDEVKTASRVADQAVEELRRHEHLEQRARELEYAAAREPHPFRRCDGHGTPVGKTFTCLIRCHVPGCNQPAADAIHGVEAER
jgi:hypothetical protein